MGIKEKLLFCIFKASRVNVDTWNLFPYSKISDFVVHHIFWGMCVYVFHQNFKCLLFIRKVLWKWVRQPVAPRHGETCGKMSLIIGKHVQKEKGSFPPMNVLYGYFVIFIFAWLGLELNIISLYIGARGWNNCSFSDHWYFNGNLGEPMHSEAIISSANVPSILRRSRTRGIHRSSKKIDTLY